MKFVPRGKAVWNANGGFESVLLTHLCIFLPLHENLLVCMAAAALHHTRGNAIDSLTLLSPDTMYRKRFFYKVNDIDQARCICVTPSLSKFVCDIVCRKLHRLCLFQTK